MQFNDTFITNVGKTLLARSVAQEGTLIWTSAKTSDADMENFTIAQMNNLTNIFASPLDKYTSSGEVTNAIVNDEESTVTMYSELNNRDYNGLARVYGMWAKIEGDENETLVIVARCGSGVTPTTINPYSVGYEKFFVNCAIEITAEQANAIEVSETNYYASSEALSQEVLERQSLASRVVTCHISGDETTGEAQTIYGVKTFVNKLYANNVIETPRTDSMLVNAPFITTWNSIDYDEYSYIGTSSHQYKHIYAKNIGDENSHLYGIVTSKGITPHAPNSYDIGASNNRYAYVYCSTLDTSGVTCSGNMSCSGAVTTNSLAPSTSLGSSVGTSGSHYQFVYGDNLVGVIPTVTDSTTIPVGSIVVLKDTREIIGVRFNVGDIFDCSASSYKDKFVQCSLSGTPVSTSAEYLLEYGTFKAISYLPSSENVFLAIKISD